MFNAHSRLYRTVAALLATAIVALGCSKGSPTGPAEVHQTPTEQIGVSAYKLVVYYDCDGVNDNPGDYYYTLVADTMGTDGNWHMVGSNKEKAVSANSGDTKTLSGPKLSFSLPRIDQQAFRVRVSLRENDGKGTNDFARSATFYYFYDLEANEWKPNTTNRYFAPSTATNGGTQSWSIFERDPKTFAGIKTAEGCYQSLLFTVSSVHN